MQDVRTFLINSTKALLHAKQRHEFRSLLENTAGILFLGCLNDESYPNFQDLCLKCAAVELGLFFKDKVIESFKKDDHWGEIKEVMEEFRALRCSFPIHVMYELKSTTISERFYVKKKQEWVCMPCPALHLWLI